MSGETRSLTFSQPVPASPDALYRALTNATALREWLCDMATIVPREGGRCYLAWNDGYYTSGEFTRLDPGRLVAFTWHGRGEPAASAVEVTLTTQDDATLVRVVHGDLGTGPAWDQIVPALEKAWPFSLENLHSIFTTGADLRLIRRPLLGVMVAEFDAEVAARLGVPVTEGVRLDDVMPELGAGAAGLRENDVVVAIDGDEVLDWATLNSALQQHRAGDDVAVTFYRGPDRQQVTMTLSGRPIPEIPADLQALTAAVRERYAQIDRELADFFAGVGEAEAAHRPAPGAWSAREVLAHLIQIERGWQNWMADMVAGHEAWYDDWGGNVQAWIDATVEVFPTADELLAELRRLNAETVAFVAALPPDFPERKATFWRLAFQFLQPPFHHRTHMDQMHTAIAAAGPYR